MPIDYAAMSSCMQVIDLISQGHTPTAACQEARISYATFRKHCRDTPELADLLADALQLSYDIMADKLVTIDREESDPKMAKVLSDNIKWLLSKRDHTKFGDRVTVNNHLTADKAILDALDAAKHRVIDVTPNYTLLPATSAEAPVYLDLAPTSLPEDEDWTQFL